jgi:hypothetical protein
VVFKAKLDEFGNVLRFKSRVVVQGCGQRPGTDFDGEQLFAPVCAYSSLRMMLSLACQLDWDIHGYDVSNAFLNAKLPDVIYMEQPPDAWGVPPILDAAGKPMVCLLFKSLYGLKQAPRLWHQLMREHLLQHGWEQLRTDKSLYMQCNGGRLSALLAVYVDDMALTAAPGYDFLAFSHQLNSSFKATYAGEVSMLLGMVVERDRAAGTLRLHQHRYLTQLLADADLSDCNASQSPIETGAVPDPHSPLLSEAATTKYRSAVGGLQYAVSATRPDLAVACSNLARHLRAPTMAHAAMLQRVHRYVKGTLALGITYHRGESPFTLHGWCDADWGGHITSSRSTTGYLLHLHGGPIAWKSTLQTTVASSSAEAEYMSAHAAIQQSLNLRNLLLELTFPQAATVLQEDNQGAIFTAGNDVSSGKLRHVRMKYHAVREQVTVFKNIVLAFCPSADNVADVMTKALHLPRFQVLARRALGALS